MMMTKKETVHTFSTTHQKLLSIIISEETRIANKEFSLPNSFHFGSFISKFVLDIYIVYSQEFYILLYLDPPKSRTVQ